MKWIVLILLAGCAGKMANRWCAEPEGKRKLCYESEEKCNLEQKLKNTGVFCTQAP